MVGRCNITEKWGLPFPFPFSPTSRPQQPGDRDRDPLTQSGQDPSPQLGLYQTTERPDRLENLSEFPSLRQFPPESQRHDLQPALAFPPESTAVEGVMSGDFPGASSSVSQTPGETLYNHDQSYTSHSTYSGGMFANPQNEWSSPIYHVTGPASPNLTSTLYSGSLQEHGPDFRLDVSDWHGYAGYSPSGTGYSGVIAPPAKLEDEICNSLQSPLAGPSTSIPRVRGAMVSDCECPEGVLLKKGGASVALRGAADRKRKRPRRYICKYCDDSFTSRQNLHSE